MKATPSLYPYRGLTPTMFSQVPATKAGTTACFAAPVTGHPTGSTQRSLEPSAAASSPRHPCLLPADVASPLPFSSIPFVPPALLAPLTADAETSAGTLTPSLDSAASACLLVKETPAGVSMEPPAGSTGLDSKERCRDGSETPCCVPSHTSNALASAGSDSPWTTDGVVEAVTQSPPLGRSLWCATGFDLDLQGAAEGGTQGQPLSPAEEGAATDSSGSVSRKRRREERARAHLPKSEEQASTGAELLLTPTSAARVVRGVEASLGRNETVPVQPMVQSSSTRKSSSSRSMMHSAVASPPLPRLDGPPSRSLSSQAPARDAEGAADTPFQQPLVLETPFHLGREGQEVGRRAREDMALIILNFDLPPYTLLLWEQAGGLKLCADGGANRLFDFIPLAFPNEDPNKARSRYIPDVIKGDLDSIRPEVLLFYKAKGAKVMNLSEDQDTTDLHKCVQHVVDEYGLHVEEEQGDWPPPPRAPTAAAGAAQGEGQSGSGDGRGARKGEGPAAEGADAGAEGDGPNASGSSRGRGRGGAAAEAADGGALECSRAAATAELVQRSTCKQQEVEIVVIGALGGRIDHEFGNINVLHRFSSVRIILLSSYCLLTLLPANKRVVIRPNRAFEGPHCGLIPVVHSSSGTTTTGLRWNLKDLRMRFGGLVSTSNQLADDQVTVESDVPLLWTTEIRALP